VDRGLLDIASGIPWTRKDVKSSAGQNRMEKAILERCKSSCALNVLTADKSLLDLARQEYEDKLKAQGLVPDAAQLQFRFVSMVVAVVALAGVAGLKVWIALERGRGNVAFLIILAIVAVIIAIKIGNPYRTILGSAYLKNVR